MAEIRRLGPSSGCFVASKHDFRWPHAVSRGLESTLMKERAEHNLGMQQMQQHYEKVRYFHAHLKSQKKDKVIQKD